MTDLQVRSRGPVALTLDLDAYYDVCHEHGITTDTRAADAFGINRSVATRLRHGTQRPGNPFLAGVADALGFDLFPTLFVVVEDISSHRLATAQRIKGLVA